MSPRTVTSLSRLCLLVIAVVLLNAFASAQTGFTAGPGSPITTGASANYVVVGDFNNDGTVGTSLPFATGVATGQPEGLTVGDFNGDTNADLAVANPGSNLVSILLGNGNGSFQLPTTVTTGNAPSAVVTADLNGDGHLDL